MADNIELDPGTGGATVATDDVGGVHYQVVKLAVGAADSATLVGNAAPIPVSDAGGALTVDGTVAVTNAGLTALNGAIAGTEVQVDVLTMPSTAVTNAGLTALNGAIAGTEVQVDVLTLPAIPAGANNIGDVDVLTVPADPFGANADAASATGSISAKLRFIAATGIPITGTVTVGSHAVTNAGTFAVQAATAGIAADDAAVSGNPVLNAGISIQTDGTDPGAVSAEGDVATLRTDMQRNLLVNQTHPRFWHVSADYGAAQTNASVKATPGASLSLYITDLVLSNGATAGNITLLDGSGGTVLFEIYPAINGGVSLSLRNPIKLTANTALCITSTTVTTHSIFVSGYIAP